MNKFFSDLKQTFIKNNVPDGCGYYETLWQHKDEIAELINDYENGDMNIRYQSENTEGYSEGSLVISFVDWRNSKYTYSIKLLYDERYWGYCECTPSDEGYDPVRDCCGNGCDWVAPRVSVTKTSDLTYASFNGVERDLWKLEKSWSVEQEDNEKEKIDEQLKWFDEQIAGMQKRKELFLQEHEIK